MNKRLRTEVSKDTHPGIHSLRFVSIYIPYFKPLYISITQAPSTLVHLKQVVKLFQSALPNHAKRILHHTAQIIEFCNDFLLPVSLPANMLTCIEHA